VIKGVIMLQQFFLMRQVTKQPATANPPPQVPSEMPASSSPSTKK
jgi:hypothetical protein